MGKITNGNHLRTAMVLAAGFGTRMRELTKDIPKPLLPLNNHRIIDVVLSKLAAQRIKHVVINLHYLGDQVEQNVGNGNQYGLEVIYSPEEVLLDTGGGIANAESLFAGETILAANADVLSDISISSFFGFHNTEDAIATMAVYPSRNNNDYSLVLYDGDNNLCGFLAKNQPIPEEYNTGIFTGYQILTPQARNYLKPTRGRPTKIQSIISGFYQPALQRNERIKIYPFSGQWVDLGSKEKYLTFRNEVQKGKIDLKKFMT